MIKNVNDQNNQVDIDIDDEPSPSGLDLFGEEIDQEDGDGKDPHPNELLVTLKAATVNGDDCVELYFRTVLREIPSRFDISLNETWSHRLPASNNAQ